MPLVNGRFVADMSPRTPDNEEPAAERACDFRPVDKGFTEEMALAEAERCLNCKKPFCVEGCPVNINIPRFIQQSARRTSAALSIPSARTPCFPLSAAVFARRRTSARASASVVKKSEPVAIGQLERFLATRPELASTPKIGPQERQEGRRRRLQALPASPARRARP